MNCPQDQWVTNANWEADQVIAKLKEFQRALNAVGLLEDERYFNQAIARTADIQRSLRKFRYSA